MVARDDLKIKSLGPCRINSPITDLLGPGHAVQFVTDDDRVLYDHRLAAVRGSDTEKLRSLELAGPRTKLFFDPSKTKCGIVTCGGLCPGLNDVVRGLVMELWYRYAVRHIFGFLYGFQGFIAKYGHPVWELKPHDVSAIHELGGSVLASSRGKQDVAEIVDCLERMSINILFLIGGDGAFNGGLALAQEIEKRGLKIGIIGIPKTIDNDIMFLDQSFGFQTAYSEAVDAIQGAHVEARGAPNGVGLVKLMGRHSGFIACHAALACSDVNYVLIPELPFELEGANGFLASLQTRLKQRHHAVVVVAEGAGQNLIRAASDSGEAARDASGNIRLRDIGLFLKDRIERYFGDNGIEINLKYIDPSYMIRSVPASPADKVYCWRLAQHAVHAAMCGKTEMMVGQWHNRLVHVPISLAISGRKQVDPLGDLWLSVLEATGQPPSFLP